MSGLGTRGLALGALLGCLFAGGTSGAAPPEAADPAYVLGYATATLDRAEPLTRFSVALDDGTLLVSFAARPDPAYDTLLRSLLAIDGIERVVIDVAGEQVAEGVAPPDADTGGIDGEADDDEGRFDYFLVNELFDPLLADPRWPRFSASHLWFFDDEELERVGAANFGETFVLVRAPEADWGQWELAFQAGVFSVFDLEASSSDLVNADYWVGLGLAHHYGDLTSMVRIYHQSSHLGDEYLLRTRVDRVNLSFEVVDALLSFEPARWFRIYGGGGVIVHREPAIDRGLVQAGIEIESPIAFGGGFLRPIAAFDLQLREESDWKTDTSVRAGVLLEHPYLRRSRLAILGEFYSGRSPNGQFYERRIKTLGLGIQLGF